MSVINTPNLESEDHLNSETICLKTILIQRKYVELYDRRKYPRISLPKQGNSKPIFVFSVRGQLRIKNRLLAKKQKQDMDRTTRPV